MACFKMLQKLQERAQVRFPGRKKGRMAKAGTEPTDGIIFSHEEGNDNHQSRYNKKKPRRNHTSNEEKNVCY
jgi:hypothetical protein